MIAPLPPDEAGRQKALDVYRILDTGPEPAFDDLTALAAQICGTPIALISLIDHDRQWFKSKVGLNFSELPRSIAFCAHGVLQPEPLIVPDARLDDRFAANPLVTTGIQIRFYHGVPLTTPEGQRIGMLCTIDSVPRTLSSEQGTSLEVLAHQVVAQLELRRTLSDHKETIAQLRHTETLLRAAVHSRSQFLANMSHEIRTPMNAVVGMTSLLLDTPLDRVQRDYVETVRHSGDLLLTIINDILDFSTIDAGHLTLETLDFDLRDVLEDTLEMLAEKAQLKGLELLGLMPFGTCSSLRGDAGRLGQVLTNLLNNAIKFTEHGEVALRVRQVTDMEGAVKLRFEVKDTGIGISRATQDHLFQAFSQADGTVTRKYGGTGLGLAIARQLVGMMQGEIGLESELGHGSTFWFTAQFEKRAALPSPPDHREMSGLHVLIVDDNGTSRKILALHCTHLHLRPEAVAGGREALAVLRTRADTGDPFDLAILDLMMPGMDGLTLARAIRADAALSHTRLVMLTALGQQADTDVFREAGIEDLLVKPVKRTRLYECLASVTGRASPRLPASTVPAPLPRQGAIRRLPRILVAEDNPINQKVVLRQLHKLGHHADAVANGLEALAALQRIPYDVILMDCQMPEMDGYKASRAIRKRERDADSNGRRKTPVYIIALTANALQGDRESCLGAGMNDYLSKPVRPPELKAALAGWEPMGPDPANPDADGTGGVVANGTILASSTGA
ncbi:MAG TPA: response regulator [Chthoniobacterales bacterium]